MVGDPAARRSRRAHLHGADPARLGQRDLRERLEPHVLSVGRHGVGLRLEDQVRRSELFRELPAVVLRPLFGRRHVLRVAQRRARVHPPRDQFDLVIAQRDVVLKVLDADRLIQMPRRHGAPDYALLDGLHPGPRFFIGHQRHGSHLSGAVAGLALFLKDGRDVLGERRRFGVQIRGKT